MDSKSKRKNCNQKDDFEDRLSNLPDALLCYILSLVPTLIAVRTTILAKRWKPLWTYVDNFDFDYSLHQWSPIEKGKDFIKFGDMVLRNSNVSSIRKFRVSCWWVHDISKISLWVCTAISHNVKELDLSIRSKDPMELPQNLFTCETLVVLKLSSTFFTEVPEFVRFSSLKILKICQWRCLVDDPMKNILAGTPVLEELCLQGVIFENLQRLCVSCLTLKRLMIWVLYPKVVEENLVHDIIINSPKLEYLYVKDCHLNGLEVKECPVLVKASVYFFGFGNGVFDFLSKISNVKHLLLFPKAGMSFVPVLDPPPLLSNLTHLELQITDCWQFISPVLDCSPNLQVLTCEKASRCSINRHRGAPSSICKWDPPAKLPKCLSCLTRIEIRFNGCDNEMKLVSYFLKNSTVLKTMVIRHAHNFVKKFESAILKELLRFPRGSVDCEVDFRS